MSNADDKFNQLIKTAIDSRLPTREMRAEYLNRASHDSAPIPTPAPSKDELGIRNRAFEHDQVLSRAFYLVKQNVDAYVIAAVNDSALTCSVSVEGETIYVNFVGIDDKKWTNTACHMSQLFARDDIEGPLRFSRFVIEYIHRFFDQQRASLAARTASKESDTSPSHPEVHPSLKP